jgi:hypothetical protein
MSLKNFYEQHLQLHTFRVELKSGKILRFAIDGARKGDLEEWLREPDVMDPNFSGPFLSFYTNYDRMVFVRIAAVRRFIFCWNPVHGAIDAGAYTDPFNIMEREKSIEPVTDEVLGDQKDPDWLYDPEPDSETKDSLEPEEINETSETADEPDYNSQLDIPDAIVLVDGDEEPILYYDLDDEADSLMIDNEMHFHSLSFGERFISFADEDGEQNYIPVENILCLDVSRRLVYNDQEWAEMERRRMLDNNVN